MMKKLKSYVVYWTETNEFRLWVKARDEAHAEEVFEQMYQDDYEKKVKDEADFYDGTYSFGWAEEDK